MATGSQAAKRDRRDAAGYTTGRPQHQPRCGSCMLAEKVPGTQRQTAHDLLCSLHSTGVKTHGICSAWVLKASAVIVRTVQLQINQSGSWRAVLNFDASGVPDEFLQAAEDLVRLSGADATMRIVTCETGPNGGPVATRTVLMTWSRKTGWAKT